MRKEDKKLRKDILQSLYDSRYKTQFQYLSETLQTKFEHLPEVNGQLDIFSSRVQHLTDVLVGAGLVKTEMGGLGNGGTGRFVSLTELGYAEFDPLYKKGWRFFTNDMAKILSIAATILSILSLLNSFAAKTT